MANITVRDIPNEIFNEIKMLAERERRSLNSQVIVGLTEYVTNQRTTEQRLAKIRDFRASIDTKGFHPTQEELKQFVEEGRP